MVGSHNNAYLYVRGTSGWPTSPTVTLAVPGDGQDVGFGQSLAMTNDTLVVGSENSGPGAAVYVYSRSASGWPSSPTVTLTDPVATAGDFYGYGVGISGSTIIVGALNSSTVGSVYFYVKGATGWPTTPTTTVKDPTDRSDDCFGISVAASGSNAIIGAGCNRSPAGKAYIYAKSPAGWAKSPVATLHPTLPAGPNDYFGSMVAISGSVASVGAWGTPNPAGRTRAGAVYLYQEAGGAWPTTATVTLRDPAETFQDSFGYSISMSSGVVFVGACETAEGSGPEAGAAYFYRA